MSDLAIKVQGIYKKYKLGVKSGYKSLRESLMNVVRAPARAVGRKTAREAATDSASSFWALNDVSFEVKKGAVVGIIGRNGAGKSTLLKILTRITEPTRGRIEMRGRVGSLLEVGTGFHPELTGRENIYLNGAVLGMTSDDVRRKFDEIVAFSEVEKFLDTPVKRYSSGMYMRLAFAVAAHLEPEILIVDEVLAVGDAAFQNKCLGRMGEVAQGGRTVLFVSHNMAAMSQMAKTVIWLKEGRLQEAGSPASVIQNYLSDGTSHVPQRSWTYPGDAPGDDRVRLIGARILQHGEVRSIIDINAPFQVEMVLRVLKKSRNLIGAVNLFNSMGLCLFSSADWRPNDLDIGDYRKIVDFPPQLIAEGVHSVLLQLVFFDPHVQSVVLRDALNFEAIDSDSPSAVRGLYREEVWPGVMRPALPWTEFKPVVEL